MSKKVESLESELKQTKQTYNAALTKLIKRVKKLEQTIKTSQARRRAKVVISDDEEVEEDPSNQGRSLIEELDLDARISLVPPHVADQGRFDETHISDQPEEQLGVFSAATALADAARRSRSVENVQTYTRRKREVSTGSGGVSTASRLVITTDISIASELDSNAGVKAKDKGKAIMHESEPPKKIKKRVQVQMSVDEELAKKVFEDEQARLNAEQEARFKAEQEQERIDFETALELQKQLDEKEEVATKEAHDIDWSDPSVLRYHALQNRPFSVTKVRKNMCMYLKNQGGYKMSHFKGMSYKEIRPIFERVWDQIQSFVPMDFEKEKGSEKKTGGRRMKSLARKRAKETLSEEKEESLDVESLATKYPIVDWETQILANDKYYYQIKRTDGSVKHYKIFSAILYDFDRQDKLHNFCGVHVLLMDTGLVIHMMVEKKYPLSQDTLSKMLSRSLEVDHQSEMGYELIRLVQELSTAQDITNSTNWVSTARRKVSTASTELEQFWQTTALSTNEDGVRGITATIDRKVKVFVSEASIRRHLKLEDSDGISSLPTAEIFKQLALIGFIQIFLNKHKRMLFPHKRTFPTPTLTQKLFSNMKRASKGYSGVDILLFPSMLTTPESSPSRITSSPSLSPQTHPSTSQPPSTPPSNQTTPVTEEAAPMPHESPLQSVHSLGRDEGSLSLNELTDLCTSLSKKVESLESELKQTKQTYHAALTKLIKRVKKLEQTIKISQARRRAKVVISDAEEDEEDPSKQGRSLIEELDLDARISLVPPHAADQGRIDDTQISDQPEEQLGVFSAATALADAARRIQMLKMFKLHKEDKGKAIMQESEPPKKIKKRVQVQMSVDEELAKKVFEEEQAKFKAEHQQEKPFSVAEVRKNICLYLKNQGGYKLSHFKGMKYEDIRHIFEKVWDQNQAFIPMEEIVQQDDVIAKQVVKESSKTTRGRRKKSLARKRAKETLSEESVKKQKLEDDTEKEEL
ncbi:hypothetical protein Tco_0837918 [Tanacetum coccineum]